MKFNPPVFLFMVVLAWVAGCSDAGRSQAGARSGDAKTNAAPEVDDATSPTVNAPADSFDQVSDPLRGTVKETMDSGGYTYVLVAAERGEVWAAARKFAVAVGDEVELAGLQLMRNFRSRSLGRVFEEIQFVGLAKVVGGDDAAKSIRAQSPTQDLPPGHPPLAGEAPNGAEEQPLTNALPPGHPTLAGTTAPLTLSKPSGPKPGEIERLAGSVTVAELFAKKADLAGKTVKFRGQVVKASRQILGSNWLHIQDGTGEPGTNDITVTSKKDFAPLGSNVVIQGTLAVNKDFGAGYSYDVIIEDATVVPARSDLNEEGHAPQPAAERPEEDTEGTP